MLLNFSGVNISPEGTGTLPFPTSNTPNNLAINIPNQISPLPNIAATGELNVPPIIPYGISDNLGVHEKTSAWDLVITGVYFYSSNLTFI